MSSILDPMTFDDLSELYRVEMKNNSITSVRKDVFSEIAKLLIKLKTDYDKQMSINPGSIICEGINQKKNRAERLYKDIMYIRTQKICMMAIRGAIGAENNVDILTDEERLYYDAILELSKKHILRVDNLSGDISKADTDEISYSSRNGIVDSISQEIKSTIYDNTNNLAPIVVRVLEDLPPFVGPKRDYSLIKEDIVTMPSVMALSLVECGKATIIKPTP